jgi:hypothetical protein
MDYHYHVCEECSGEWPCEDARCEPNKHGVCPFVCRDCKRQASKAVAAADAYRISRRENEVI